MRPFSVQGLAVAVLVAAVARSAHAQSSVSTTAPGTTAVTDSSPSSRGPTNTLPVAVESSTLVTLETSDSAPTGGVSGSPFADSPSFQPTHSRPSTNSDNTAALPPTATTTNDNHTPTGEIDGTLAETPARSTTSTDTTSSAPPKDQSTAPTSTVPDSTTSTTAPETRTTSSVPTISTKQTTTSSSSSSTKTTTTPTKTTETTLSTQSETTTTTSTTPTPTPTSTSTSTSTTAPTLAPTPTPSPTVTAGESSRRSRRTVVELITTFVDGSISIGEITRTEEVAQSTSTTAKRGGGLYTSTYTKDGEVKIVTGTLPDGPNSSASSALLSATGAMLVSVVLALSVASSVF